VCHGGFQCKRSFTDHDDNTFNCKLLKPNIIQCQTNHTQAIPTELTIKLSDQMNFICQRSKSKLVCVADPNNGDKLTTLVWRLYLATSESSVNYVCKNLDEQLLCLATSQQKRRNDLTVAVPLAGGELLLFDCLKNASDDLHCAPHPKNSRSPGQQRLL
jgi:hypothetical protein